MLRHRQFSLLAGVALPLAVTAPAWAQDAIDRPIVLAQAGALAAAQAEVAAAQAALAEAQASGGDVAAAQARLDAALQALAAARDAQPAPEPQPEPQPQSEPEPQPEPEPEAAEPPPPETPPEPPAAEQPPAPEAPPAPPAVEPPPPEQPAIEPPAADEQPPAEEPPPQPPAAEEPPAEEPQAEAPPPEPQQAEPPPAPQPPAAEAPESAEPPPPPPESQAAPVEEPPAAEQPPPARAEAPPTAEAPEGSAVEAQLEAQGDDEAVENVRSLREKLRQEFARGGRGDGADEGRDEDGRRDDDRDGHDRDRRGRDRPPEEGRIVLDFGGHFIVEIGDQLVIRQDDAYEQDRFLDRARDVEVEHFPGGYTRTVVTRRNGTRIYTVRNRYGDIITRTRVDRDGRRFVLIDNRDFYRDGRRPRYARYEDELPPLRIGIPREQYIVETRRVGREGIYEALLAPPVESVEQPYALEEIRYSERLRNKMRRVDLDTITFDFGSAAVTPSQFDALSAVGAAIEDILARSPDEIFLIEGHTDAVGSDTDNLFLSERRAEAIAVALSTNFEIPPENLVTQGYGEQYLKIATEEAERENRRVTVRRITPLVAQGN